MIRFMSVLATAFAAAATLRAEPAKDPKEADTNFDNLKPIVAGIGKAKEVVLYEGLPHQGLERKVLDDELKSKKTVELHGYPFYAEKPALKVADARKLQELFVAEDSFTAFRGEKKCGGFHPDYCIEWRNGNDVYRVLVCFGCHEVKCYSPKQTLRCDIQKGAYDAFAKVLKPYRKNRPEPIEP